MEDEFIKKIRSKLSKERKLRKIADEDFDDEEYLFRDGIIKGLLFSFNTYISLLDDE